MKKEKQKAINADCELMKKHAFNELFSTDEHGNYIYNKPFYKGSPYWKRLRTMSAYVIETKHYYFLRSYNSIIAFINKGTDECIDVLRLVYGYKATSAKHVSAFDHDYGQDKWGCRRRFTWRDC